MAHHPPAGNFLNRVAVARPVSAPDSMFSSLAGLPAPGSNYRGRLAPSPTGYLHLGHARTFWIAYKRASAAGGTLVLRNEDLDLGRARPQFATAVMEDLRWFGIQWQEGPDVGGPFAPYIQSRRREHYWAALQRLARMGGIYPCTCSRRDIEQAAQAPHESEAEPIYPGTCRRRPPREGQLPEFQRSDFPPAEIANREAGAPRVNWRFRVPDGERIAFVDGWFGSQEFVAGKDFGDFIVWRHDDMPSYQLAVVIDDAAMKISEVVRGADLLLSTARQLLLYRALDLAPPRFFHCPLVTDESGRRLAKRHDALSLRALRQRGMSPESLRMAVGPPR